MKNKLSFSSLIYIFIFFYSINLAAQNNPVVSFQKISNTQGNLGNILNANDCFSNGLDSIGDINGDGVTDVIISAFGDDQMGTNVGAIYVLKLNSSGAVVSSTKISKNLNGFTGNLQSGDIFGSGLASLGDINGDGNYDIAVGAEYTSDGGYMKGVVYLITIDTSGYVLSTQKISATSGGFTGILNGPASFGCDIANIGDLNGDGVNDLVVGSHRDNDGGTEGGAIWILFMNSNGTVHHQQKISDTQGGFSGNIDAGDHFGVSTEYLGDINNDGYIELAVGSHYDDDGGQNNGAIYILSLDTGGMVVNSQKISDSYGGFNGVLSTGSKFGVSITKIGDLNNDSVIDIAVGAYRDNTVGSLAGAFYILYLNANGSVKSHLKVTTGYNNFTGNIDAGDLFGVSIASIGKYNDLYALLVGSRKDDDGAIDAGAAYVLFIRGIIYSGVESIVIQDDFVYNNPVHDQLYIWQNIGILNLSIFDMNGKLVKKSMVKTNENVLNISNLASGTYLGVIVKGNYRKSFKIIKE